MDKNENKKYIMKCDVSWLLLLVLDNCASKNKGSGAVPVGVHVVEWVWLASPTAMCSADDESKKKIGCFGYLPFSAPNLSCCL